MSVLGGSSSANNLKEHELSNIRLKPHPLRPSSHFVEGIAAVAGFVVLTVNSYFSASSRAYSRWPAQPDWPPLSSRGMMRRGARLPPCSRKGQGSFVSSLQASLQHTCPLFFLPRPSRHLDTQIPFTLAQPELWQTKCPSPMLPMLHCFLSSSCDKPFHTATSCRKKRGVVPQPPESAKNRGKLPFSNVPQVIDSCRVWVYPPVPFSYLVWGIGCVVGRVVGWLVGWLVDGMQQIHERARRRRNSRISRFF